MFRRRASSNFMCVDFIARCVREFAFQNNGHLAHIRRKSVMPGMVVKSSSLIAREAACGAKLKGKQGSRATI